MVRKYEKREGSHGNDWGAWAKIEVSEAGEVTFAAPQIYTGLISTSLESSQESTTFYADNQEHITIMGEKVIEGSLSVYQFPKAFSADHLGRKLDPSGLILDTGLFTNFAWQHIVTVTDELGNEYEELHIWYNVKAGSPTADSETDGESVEVKVFEIPLKARVNNNVLDVDGKAVAHAYIRKTEENKALFETAYDKILLPGELAGGGA